MDAGDGLCRVELGRRGLVSVFIAAQGFVRILPRTGRIENVIGELIGRADLVAGLEQGFAEGWIIIATGIGTEGEQGPGFAPGSRCRTSTSW